MEIPCPVIETLEQAIAFGTAVIRATDRVGMWREHHMQEHWHMYSTMSADVLNNRIRHHWFNAWTPKQRIKIVVEYTKQILER